jgi:(1->4)-alpha-D-glucan 1-alpha-D-glucosylmutase
LWELSLVDPDNRRAVDYDLRAQMLRQLQQEGERSGDDRIGLVRRLMESWKDGRIKLYIMQEGLRHRRANAALYLEGDYVPLDCEGRYKSHLCAFARLHQDLGLVAVVPRLVTGLGDVSGGAAREAHVWQDTWMAVPSWKNGSVYRNILTGERLETVTQGERQMLPVGAVLNHCPVGLLERCT